MKKKMLLMVLFMVAVAGVASADMIYDAGSSASGYPDTPGSIVDADTSYDTEFWTYNNLGSTESLTPDSYVVAGAMPSGWKNTYSRVYFEGTHDPAAHHQVADLGFDIHDPTVEYSINMRLKIDSTMAFDGDKVFTMYSNAGVGNGYSDGLHIWNVIGTSTNGEGGVVDGLEIAIARGNQAPTPINYGQWYDVSLAMGAVDGGARPVTLLLDGVEVDDFKWGGYWGYNSGEAYTYWGVSGNNVSSSYEVDYYSVTSVPEPMTMVLLGLGGLFIRRRKA